MEGLGTTELQHIFPNGIWSLRRTQRGTITAFPMPSFDGSTLPCAQNTTLFACFLFLSCDWLRFSFSAAPASAWGTCINPLPSYTWNLDKG
ncbi:hypothetical protein V6N13_107912 [Hibiscus sabdariffa]